MFCPWGQGYSGEADWEGGGQGQGNNGYATPAVG